MNSSKATFRARPYNVENPPVAQGAKNDAAGASPETCRQIDEIRYDGSSFEERNSKIMAVLTADKNLTLTPREIQTISTDLLAAVGCYKKPAAECLDAFAAARVEKQHAIGGFCGTNGVRQVFIAARLLDEAIGTIRKRLSCEIRQVDAVGAVRVQDRGLVLTLRFQANEDILRGEVSKLLQDLGYPQMPFTFETARTQK